jgi:hypothetical protein
MEKQEQERKEERTIERGPELSIAGQGFVRVNLQDFCLIMVTGDDSSFFFDVDP